MAANKLNFFTAMLLFLKCGALSHLRLCIFEPGLSNLDEAI